MLTKLRHLWDHARWAESILLTTLHDQPDVPAEAPRELGHIIGAGELWLSRLEGRPSRAALWPMLTVPELKQLFVEVDRGYAKYLDGLDESDLTRLIPYVNTAGQSFETSVEDILLHVALHAQYHRGKINLLLRQRGLNPAPTDYIAFVRGVPAATTSLGSL